MQNIDYDVPEVYEMISQGDTDGVFQLESGGLDADVTPENFARMFYRRKGVDRYFIELQWELEELTSLIAKNKQKPAKDSQELVQTPEQKAVSYRSFAFCDRIRMRILL